MRRVPPSVVKTAVLALLLSATISGQSPIASLSSDLLAMLLTGNSATVRAIIRGDVDDIQAAAARDGVPVLRVLDGMVVVEATANELNALRQIPSIKSISRDNIVGAFQTVDKQAMAADQAQKAQYGFLGIGSYPAVTGKGVGVAIVDSGIAAHAALTGKVVAAANFVTGEDTTTDLFGHGTHIAGIVAGQKTTVTSLYDGGVATGAHLINVRVLGRNGAGFTSDVIAGVQWAVANRGKYGIKVMNLSLGHPQVEPCITDPLCIAVEQAVASGLVVVVSAGNNGKDDQGREVLASITSPGVSPNAITVGSLTTWLTASPDDDTVSSYSSRGPTRFELGLKPDLVAPGNKIVSLQAQGSYLAKKYPELHVAGVANNAYTRMSGTSMAAAMISGGAALLLEGTTLTARQIKIALQLSARFMPDEGFLRAGLGRANLYSARRVNSALTALTGTIPPVTIAGRTVQPTGLTMPGGRPLLDSATAPAGMEVVGALGMLATWLDAIVTPARVMALKGAQFVWGDQIPAQQFVWGDHSPLGQQFVWGDRTPFGQQFVWGDQSVAEQLMWGSQTLGQQFVWGDQTFGQQFVWGDETFGQQFVWGDQTLGQQFVWGDQTSGQQFVWGDADTSGAYQFVWGDSVPPQQ